MTGFEVEFLGCKVSHTDAESIRDALEAAGHEPAAGAAAVAVVNTCCITAEAEKKSRQRIRRLLGGAPDEARLFVTGCGAARDPEQYTVIDPRVTVVPGAASLAAPAIVEAADELAGLGCRGPATGVAPGHVAGRPSATRRTRAFVKVQDGCDFDCSYCIVPIVRGAPRSRPLPAVLDEVARRAGRGQREIVLTGVNIGLYRDPGTRAGLDRLLLAVCEIDAVARVRISSIESNHVNRRLVAAMASSPKVCPHLHVPLQSGDDAVLAAMGRHYDSRRYARAIEAARAQLPGLNLTTDVIVGYPTEDEAAFQRTCDLVERLAITKVHAFPFSQRPGTELAAVDPVPRQVKADRSRRLRALADARALEHRASLIGRADRLLVEARGGPGPALTDDHAAIGQATVARAATIGYLRDYTPARLVESSHPWGDGDLVDVRITGLDRATGAAQVVALDPGAIASPA